MLRRTGKAVTVNSYWELPARLFDSPEELTGWAKAALAAAQGENNQLKQSAASLKEQIAALEDDLAADNNSWGIRAKTHD